MKRLSNVVGFDDGPFERGRRRDVPVVGAVFSRRRFDGVVLGKVRQDGANATRVLERLVVGSKFRGHLQLILLQGVALGGFNVVDAGRLSRATGLPVLVVSRRRPDLAAMRQALVRRIPAGARKWRWIEALPPMEPAGGVFVQRLGLTLPQARRVVEELAVHGHLPEPLRVAHLIAGALVEGESRGRA